DGHVAARLRRGAAEGGRSEAAGADPGPGRRDRAAGRVRLSAVLLAPLPGVAGAQPVGPSSTAPDRLRTGPTRKAPPAPPRGGPEGPSESADADVGPEL